jgi:fatty-acyl-CoA synthase
MLEVITKYKCTLAWLPNFAFQFIPRRTPQGRWSQYDLSHVRALINCSEPVRASSLHEFQRTFAASGLRKSALQTCYAMAENVFAVTQSDISRPDGPQLIWVDGSTFRSEHMVVCVSEELPGAMSFVSSGQVLAEHEVILVSETGAALAEDNVGEILIRSDCLFRGYYNRPDLTAEAFGNGWCYTGDLGFLHGGELYVVGRKKDLLIVGGENLYPHDIEEIVAGHPAIHDGRVIAIGVYNPDLGTEDIIVVGEVEQEHLLAHAAEIEREIRGGVVVALGLTVRRIFLKPPRWLVKSTAGKPSRSSTREKLFREHPDLNVVP